MHDVLLVRRAVSGFARVDLGSGATRPLPYPLNVGDANPAVIHTGDRFVWRGDFSADDGLTRAADAVPPDPQVRSDVLLPATPGAFCGSSSALGNCSVTGAEWVAVDTGRLLSPDSFNGIPCAPQRAAGLPAPRHRRLTPRRAARSCTGRTTMTGGFGSGQSLVLPAGTTIVDGMAISCVAPCATVAVQDLVDGAERDDVGIGQTRRSRLPGELGRQPGPDAHCRADERRERRRRQSRAGLEIDLRTRTARLLPDVYDLFEPTLAWTADGTRLVVVDGAGRVWSVRPTAPPDAAS